MRGDHPLGRRRSVAVAALCTALLASILPAQAQTGPEDAAAAAERGHLLEAELVERIRRQVERGLDPDPLRVALGSPRQEREAGLLLRPRPGAHLLAQERVVAIEGGDHDLAHRGDEVGAELRAGILRPVGAGGLERRTERPLRRRLRLQGIQRLEHLAHLVRTLERLADQRLPAQLDTRPLRAHADHRVRRAHQHAARPHQRRRDVDQPQPARVQLPRSPSPTIPRQTMTETQASISRRPADDVRCS